MQRGIKKAYGDGKACHGLKNPFKILPLHGEKLCQCALSSFKRVRQNHLAHGHNAVALEKHVFCPAETNAFRSEFPRDARILGCVRVGPNAQNTKFIGPSQS